MTNNHKGQAMIEIFLACLVGTVVLIGTFAVIYWLSLRIFSSYYLYEGVVCAVHSPIRICEQKTRQHILKFPMMKEIKVKLNKKTSRKSYQIYGSLRVKNSFCNNCGVLDIEDSVYVPKTYR